jgi:hypothetical protein
MSAPLKPPYLQRQRALLENLLQVTREQRRCMIDGDLKGLEETNKLLGSLLESQENLHAGGPMPEEGADARLLAELRRLAQQLRRESHTNYLLACRGAEFTRFSLSVLGHPEAGDGTADGAAQTAEAPRLVDRPA